MAFSLMTVVLIAFATVFPSGYRLNLANQMQNKATGVANSIAEELRSLDTTVLEPMKTGVTVASLVTSGYIHPDTSLVKVVDTIPNPIPADGKFYIANNGIGVEVNEETLSGEAPLRTLTVTVTVQWAESRRRTTVPKSVTVVSMTTNAIKGTGRK